MKNSIPVKTFDLTDPKEIEQNGKYPNLEIEIDYTLGGINYFTGNRYARGYRLSMTPCKISKSAGGFQTKEFSLLSGDGREPKYAFIKATQRKSQPTMQKIADKVDAEKVKELWLEKRFDDLIDYAESLG